MHYRSSGLPFSAQLTPLSLTQNVFFVRSFSPGGLKKDRDGTARYGCGDAGTPGVYSDVRHFRRTGWLDQAMSLTCHWRPSTSYLFITKQKYFLWRTQGLFFQSTLACCGYSESVRTLYNDWNTDLLLLIELFTQIYIFMLMRYKLFIYVFHTQCVSKIINDSRSHRFFKIVQNPSMYVFLINVKNFFT